MSLKRNVRVLRARFSHGRGASLWAMALAAILVPSIQAQGPPEDIGQWDEPEGGYDWDVRAEHAMHLSTGKILVWQAGTTARTWDPGDGSFTLVPNDDHNIICSGHTGLADGSILAAGGGGEHGGTATAKTSIFGSSPGPTPWHLAGEMFFDRWYPTCTTLSDGNVLVIGGTDAPGGEAYITIPEVFDADDEEWFFPSMQVQPAWAAVGTD